MRNPLQVVIAFRQRISFRRLFLQAIGIMLGLQGFIVFLLQVISLRRKRYWPQGGFPHKHLKQVQVGENVLQLYDYGRDLYEDMLAAIADAKECIYLETYIWKGDEIGQAFKDCLARKA